MNTAGYNPVIARLSIEKLMENGKGLSKSTWRVPNGNVEMGLVNRHNESNQRVAPLTRAVSSGKRPLYANQQSKRSKPLNFQKEEVKMKKDLNFGQFRRLTLCLLTVTSFAMLFAVDSFAANLGGIKGKVVDGNGRPIPKVSVTAKQTEPLEGYEQFKTTTGTDGIFRFSKLFPNSEYELIFHIDGIREDVNVRTISGPKGQTKVVSEPILIQINYIFKINGDTVIDTRLGLMWARNATLPGNRLSWESANVWVQSLNIGGFKDWRLPTSEELIFLGQGAPQKLNAVIFANMDDWYWSSTADGGSAVMIAVKSMYSTSLSKEEDRNVWPVRNTNSTEATKLGLQEPHPTTSTQVPEAARAEQKKLNKHLIDTFGSQPVDLQKINSLILAGASPNANDDYNAISVLPIPLMLTPPFRSCRTPLLSIAKLDV